jgi:ubiquinone/menaquinone biosynthesis C-methylase UbiE
MHLKPGMIVIEIGPGKGNYTKAVAKGILPDGILYAIDIQKSVIERLKIRVEKEKLSNIIPMIDDAYNLSFSENTIDRVYALACLPEIPDPVKAIKEWNRVLKPEGLISLSELFPDPDYPRRKTEIRWAEEAGLELLAEYGNWFAYQLNFGKKS